MNQELYFQRFRETVEKMCVLTGDKNADYAGQENAFLNFEAIARMTSGRVPTEAGILTRMTDKLQRVANLLSLDGTTPRVAESVSDNLIDLAVYAIILKIYVEEVHDNEAKRVCPESPLGQREVVARSLNKATNRP